MQILPINSSKRKKAGLFSVLPLAAALAGVALVGAGPAAAGSDNPSFQRHFWRGQNNHGNIDFDGRRTGAAAGPATAEALVEEGTSGAAIARSASNCASRFKSYDPSTGLYIGRDGRARACR